MLQTRRKHMTREIRDIDSASEALAHRVIATAFAEDPVLRWVNSDPGATRRSFAASPWPCTAPARASTCSMRMGWQSGPRIGIPELGTARRAEAAGHSAAARRDPAGPRSGCCAGARRRVRPPYAPSLVSRDHRRRCSRQGDRLRTPQTSDRSDRGTRVFGELQYPQQPLYERFGFKVVEEIKPTTHGPSLWAMYRD